MPPTFDRLKSQNMRCHNQRCHKLTTSLLPLLSLPIQCWCFKWRFKRPYPRCPVLRCICTSWSLAESITYTSFPFPDSVGVSSGKSSSLILFALFCSACIWTSWAGTITSFPKFSPLTYSVGVSNGNSSGLILFALFCGAHALYGHSRSS